MQMDTQWGEEEGPPLAINPVLSPTPAALLPHTLLTHVINTISLPVHHGHTVLPSHTHYLHLSHAPRHGGCPF